MTNSSSDLLVFAMSHQVSIQQHLFTTQTDSELKNTFILSATDGNKRAKVHTFIADLASLSYSEWQILFQQKLEKLQESFEQPLKWMRLEWTTNVQSTSWHTLQKVFFRYKRNYFRSGIAFEGKREPWLLLTESELHANACLYGGAEEPLTVANIKNLQRYFKARHGSSQLPDFHQDLPMRTFQTAGVFLDLEQKEFHLLSTESRSQGRRALPQLSAQNSANLIKKVTAYLAKQVFSNGKYEYGHFPCFGRTIDNYNTLRHASSTYALIEGYEFCLQQGNSTELAQIKANIDLALSYLINEIIRHYPDNRAYVVEVNNEIKLGANAVAILALVKYIQVFPDSAQIEGYLKLAEKLANGIVAMQQDDGSFVHVLDAKTLDVIAKNRVIYYDGEAAFGLMRLYGMTKDSRWIECVSQAFDYFIQAGHSEAHDHWLSYCSNELAIYKPERKYFEFALNNVKGYVSFIRKRITTFPTLLELSMAFHNMLLKLDEYPQYQDLLDGFDVADFYSALHRRANYLMNGVFFPETAMFFKLPETILYGCFIRHHAFRVRIDDVEHYLSGLIAYYHLLKTGQYPNSLVQEGHSISTEPTMGKKGLVLATGGKWIIEPDDDWQATGMSIFPKRFKAGHIVVARGQRMAKGYLPAIAVKSLVVKGASAIITDDPKTYLNFGVPVLLVDNVRKATIDIGEWIRKQFTGNVIGVTGSAGKTTTVAMLAHSLSIFGEIGQSLDSANLPAGVAWNMSMMPKDARNWIIEMAIGGMHENTQMAQPDVAIITNIAPAHLEYHKTVEMIAQKKARIFEGMKPKSLAVICRDIEQYDIIADKAKQHHLTLVSYGEHSESDIKLVKYQRGVVRINLLGKDYELRFKAKGKHFVLNAMAILATANHLGFDLDALIKQLASFKPVEGRGDVFKTQYEGKLITIYDEAYNANPLSMRAALTNFSDLRVAKKHKLLILGDMLELGVDSQKYHLELVETISQTKAREVVLVGAISACLVDILTAQKIRVSHFINKEELQSRLSDIVKDNDTILIKASNGIGLSGLFPKETN
ncbi:hypothetical protein A1D22_02810 [Pasteurellaceae bacterium LFhippo2]|nr:hypothetical protein [Pasteurellaceae bacterium LFhippo2]